MKYAYPTYNLVLPEGLLKSCLDLAPELLHEAGFLVNNDRFLSQLEGKAGLNIKGGRVYFDKDLVKKFARDFIQQKRLAIAKTLREKDALRQEWTVKTAGYSMMTIDVETEQIREGTCEDLRNMIRLAGSFGVGGDYMIMPQDLPPIMQVIACFKICYEMADNIRPYDYQQPEQIPFIYEMHQVMGKTMDIRLTIPTTMTLDPKDVDIFLDMYPIWKRNRDLQFVIGNYSMIGMSKPITATGCATMMFCENLATQILFKLFDHEIEINFGIAAGHPTDMRNVCWAFGSPRRHLFQYLTSQFIPNICGIKAEEYRISDVLLETSSSSIDELAGMEKMAQGLIGAFQGARTFGYAGVLCVDDIFSGTQFVIDVEIVNYIREVIESFDPHPDIIATEGLYEEMLSVARGEDLFTSHPNTVKRFRNIVPSSDLIVREKLRAWMSHHKTLKDRARELAIEKIKCYEPTFHLSEDRQKELDRIYEKAKKKLA